MSTGHTGVLVVGAGLAGARFAETLRGAGFTGRIVIVGDEPLAPYERPALSKEVLRGSRDPATLTLRPPEAWDRAGVELWLGDPVVAVDPGARTAALAGGRVLGWDHLVVATGARARTLPGLPDAGGIHTLRTLADAQALRADLRPGTRLAIIGGGFVGMEVAGSAIGLGVAVTVIEALPTPFAQTLGPRVGALLGAIAAEHGVDLRLDARVREVRADGGRVRSVVLADGPPVPCDTLLVAIGARPETALVRDLVELASDGGIRTDGSGRTSVPGILACGDVASPWRPELGCHRRLEHWTAAAGLARAAALAVMGEDRPDTAHPYVWSDQFGRRLQVVGLPHPDWDVQIEPSDAGLVVRWRDPDGVTRAGLAVDRPDALAGLRAELADAVPAPA